MGNPVDDLVEVLALEQLEVNLFRGVTPQTARERIFGGQVLAQALMAAGRTVPEAHPIHSMHAYFLRPGDPRVPIVFEVDRIRDGRSFVTRRIVAIQKGEAIFNAEASFHVAEGGPDHSDTVPAVPAPELVEETPPSPWSATGNPAHATPWVGESPIDLRFPGGDPWSVEGPQPPDRDVWMRADGALPDDPLIHVAVAAYASDLALLSTSTMPHTPAGSRPFMLASLDHVMWFHREFRADEWLLFHLHSPSAGGARGFAHGAVFRPDGRLAMSIAQEGLVRPMR
jgi:acyl-CoA thioesterase-2